MKEPDEEFYALPDQGKVYGVAEGQEEREAYHPTYEQRVPEPERWMNWAEKREWYMQDLLDAFGAEYISHDPKDQPFTRANLPKRSSKKGGRGSPKNSGQAELGATNATGELFGGVRFSPKAPFTGD
jgi:hypothetical protein